jgi:hypothetical protein
MVSYYTEKNSCGGKKNNKRSEESLMTVEDIRAEIVNKLAKCKDAKMLKSLNSYIDRVSAYSNDNPDWNKISGKIIGLDFDGVIHAYDGVWVEPDTITCEPVDGALDWITRAVNTPGIIVAIVSSRCYSDTFPAAFRHWCIDNGMAEEIANKIIVSKDKPPCFINIDDCGYRFKGTFPDLAGLLMLEPWWKI